MSFLFLEIAFHSTKKAYTENSSILQLTCGTSALALEMAGKTTRGRILWLGTECREDESKKAGRPAWQSDAGQESEPS